MKKRIGKAVQVKRQVAADSLQTYKLEILELTNSSDTVGELGPLKYLSGLTGTPMDVIINVLLLVIIFVFDPLAISLVVAANFAFDIAYPKRLKNLYGEFEDSNIEPPTQNNIPDDYDEDRMNIIGQNGNDGQHYDEDWTIVDEEAPGDYKDFDKNYAKYMIVDKEGNRTFLDEKPTFETKSRTIEVTLADGRRGKINRGDDNRIIYL